jgi:23S rRNA (uracil1939-C5)-methyltransferase
MAQFYSAKRRVATRQTLLLEATDLDAFGQGVARHQGKTVFVKGLLPQEQAQVVLLEDKRHFARGQVKALLRVSPQRVQPRCPHYGQCGGCQQQHASQQLQQQSKSAALQRLIMRETGVDIAPGTVIAGDEYGYRRRARLGLQYLSGKSAKNGAAKLVMGFRQEGSSQLVNIDHCPVLCPELAALLVPLRLCLQGMQGVAQFGHVELVLALQGPLLVLRHLAPLSAADTQQLRDFAAQHQLAVFLAGDSDSLQALCAEMPVYEIDGLKLQFSPRDFIQVNDKVNQQMVAQVLEWLDIRPTDRVLDLFCGMGNFTLPLAKRAAQVVGVEGVAALVANGQDNAKRNGLTNVDFYHENLEADVRQQPWATLGFDKILLDPARAGAAGVMPQIISLAPRRVVYVSCDPSTLARDSKMLLEAGYRLQKLRMLDMFPHTGHLESMALFINQSDVKALEE